VKALESLLMRAKAGMRDRLIRTGFITDNDHRDGVKHDRKKQQHAS